MSKKIIDLDYREKSIFLNFLWIFVSFIFFNLCNSFLFGAIWIQKIWIFKVLYFIALYLFFRYVYIKYADKYLYRFITVRDNIKIFKKYEAFKVFSILYFCLYLGGKYGAGGGTEPQFLSYLSTCLVSNFIAYLVYRRQYKKILKTDESIKQIKK